MWNVSLTLSLTTVMPVNLHCRYHLQQINFSLVDGVVVPYLFRFSSADFWILKITISTSLYALSLLARRHWPKYFVVTNSLHYLFLFLIIFSDGCIRHDELYIFLVQWGQQFFIWISAPLFQATMHSKVVAREFTVWFQFFGIHI